MIYITTIDSGVEKHQNIDNITVTLIGLLAIAQPWRFFYKQKLWGVVDKVNFLFTFVGEEIYNFGTTLPLQGYSISCCLGRKNRLNGGFFISNATLFDALTNKVDYENNMPVTCSLFNGCHVPLAVFFNQKSLRICIRVIFFIYTCLFVRLYCVVTTPAAPLNKAYQCGFFYA